ncbi:MAG: endonuclease domain-containing protein [Nocardioides sp.]
MDAPFTYAEALARGITAQQLRGPGFRSIFRGVYVVAHAPETVTLRAKAALLLFPPTAVASHLTAARLYSLPVPASDLVHVTVADPRDRRRTQGLQSHVRSAPFEVRLVDGVPVPGPDVLLRQLRSQLGLVALVAVADQVVRRDLLTLRDVRQLPRLGPAARLIRARVDSPMETRTRLLFHFAALPEPVVNGTIVDARGATRRADLAWPAALLIVEYDGRHHIEVREQWHSDLARRERLEDLGWRVVVLTSPDIYRYPDRTLMRVHRLLLERGQPGVPITLSTEWQHHFERAVAPRALRNKPIANNERAFAPKMEEGWEEAP